jgi:transposase
MDLPRDVAQLNTQQLRDLTTALLAQLSAKDEQLTSKNQQLSAKDEELKFKQLKIDQLTHEMAILKRWRFGRRSEQLDPGQRSLLEEPIDEDLETISLELEALRGKRKREESPKDKPRRAALPSHLPRREIRHEPEKTVCSCGCQLERIGEDVSEKLDYTPGTFQIERHVRGKWV